MMIYPLCQKLDEEVHDAFSSEVEAEAAKQRCLVDWLHADVSFNFNPRRPIPADITDPLESYLWQCDVSVWVEHYEIDVPTHVPLPGTHYPIEED